MAKINSKNVRVDVLFNDKFFEDVANARIKNNLEIKTISPREVSRMIMNAESTPSLLRELKTKPRKK